MGAEVHRLLKQVTAADHARVEAAMGLDPATLTLARYVRGLQVLQAARVTWEPEIEAQLPGSTGPHLGWLAADLAALDAAPLAPARPLGLVDPGHAWGARYVLEGSALGGRVLLRAAEGLGVSAARGARYFAGHGAGTGRVWTAFLTELAAADPPRALAGARLAFDALARLAEHGAPA